MGQELNLYGNDLFGNPIVPPSRGKVSDEFIVPPFSVLNSRDGFWQTRKRMWKRLGINSEIGRSAELCLAQSLNKIDPRKTYTGTSIFDPVTCELMYKWFCPPGGQVLDPFAGGSVRGVVAVLLGYQYWGCDLSKIQIKANRQQADIICKNQPVWVCGDSLDTFYAAPKGDFLFTCPPYGDLEKYSDHPRDISNMEYHTFIAAYSRILLKGFKKLNQNRFACIVVGDFRDKSGFLRGFVGDTERVMSDIGFKYYNEIIYLENGLNTAAMRAKKQFNAARKAIKTHQNILVFVKGDPKTATQHITSRLTGRQKAAAS